MRRENVVLIVVLLVLFSVSVLAATPVALYDFNNDNAQDTAGTADDGIVVGATFVEGPLGKALQFDGNGDVVTLPVALLHGQDDVSVSLWLKTAKTGGQSLLSGADSSNDNEFLVYLKSNTEVNFYTGEHANNFVSWTIPSVADDKWHHLVVVRDEGISDSVSFYLDGTQGVAHTTTLNVLSVTSLVLGQEQDYDGTSSFTTDINQAFQGQMDQLQLYQAPLTSEEISLLFDFDRDGVGDFSDAFPANAYEQFDTDSDGIGNNQDTDDDGDDVLDRDDAFPLDATESADFDHDEIGDVADLDDDGDGVNENDTERTDNCPWVANGAAQADVVGVGNQLNNDGDAQGDACDSDDDNDGYFDRDDNCALVKNGALDTTATCADGDRDTLLSEVEKNLCTQKDTDADGVGDSCDVCPGFFNPGQDPASCSCQATVAADEFTPNICYPQSGAPARSQCACAAAGDTNAVVVPTCVNEYVAAADRTTFASSVAYMGCDGASVSCVVGSRVNCPSGSVCDQGRCTSFASCDVAADCPAVASFAYRETVNGQEITIQQTGEQECISNLCVPEPPRQVCQTTEDCVNGRGGTCINNLCLLSDTCGNTIFQPLKGEQCDDGCGGDGCTDTDNGDGCSSLCQEEAGYDCDFAGGTECYPANQAFMRKLIVAYRAVEQPFDDTEKSEFMAVVQRLLNRFFTRL